MIYSHVRMDNGNNETVNYNDLSVEWLMDESARRTSSAMAFIANLLVWTSHPLLTISASLLINHLMYKTLLKLWTFPSQIPAKGDIFKLHVLSDQ